METPSIVSDPAVMMGKPVVVGTRLTVELILEELAAGTPVEQLLEAHPRLSREAISAALGFAARDPSTPKDLPGAIRPRTPERSRHRADAPGIHPPPGRPDRR